MLERGKSHTLADFRPSRLAFMDSVRERKYCVRPLPPLVNRRKGPKASKSTGGSTSKIDLRAAACLQHPVHVLATCSHVAAVPGDALSLRFSLSSPGELQDGQPGVCLALPTTTAADRHLMLLACWGNRKPRPSLDFRVFLLL